MQGGAEDVFVFSEIRRVISALIERLVSLESVFSPKPFSRFCGYKVKKVKLVPTKKKKTVWRTQRQAPSQPKISKSTHKRALICR
jgi:hypothetical protein